MKIWLLLDILQPSPRDQDLRMVNLFFLSISLNLGVSMKRFLILFVILCVSVSVFGQTLQERLEALTETNGQRYLQPLGDAIGANLNSGFYHTAKIKKFGLHFYIGVETIAALIGDDQRSYIANVLNNQGQIVEASGAPTIFGGKDPKNVNLGMGQSYSLPGGFDSRMLPIIAPRIQIGNIMGTELIARYVDIDIPGAKDFGKFSMKGFGLRHSISQYIPLFPIDVAFGYFVQQINIGDVIKASTTYVGIQASRKMLALEVYGGVGVESASLTAEYNLGSNVPGVASIPLSYTLDGKNKTRMNVGLTFHLLLLKVHVDYNIAAQKTVVLGAGIGL